MVHCRVCGNLLKGNVNPAAQSCGRPSCGWALENENRISKVEFRSLVAKATTARELEQTKRRLIARNQAENAAIWKAAIERSRYTDSELPLTVIPSGKSSLGKVSRSRRSSFQTHLQNVIAASYAEVPDPAAIERPLLDRDSPGSREVMRKLCSLCRGGCCSAGADTAYIKAETITEYRAENPAKSEQDIWHDYVSLIPLVTVKDSCIMHGKTGCAMPRAMRSHTCNQYLCPGTKSWLERRKLEPKASGTYVIQRRLDNLAPLRNSQDNRIIATHLVFEPHLRPACKHKESRESPEERERPISS